MDIYLHQNAPTEPAGDGSIKTIVFDDAETEYSGEATGEGFVKRFTSEAGFFTANQTLSGTWTIYYNAKVANVTDSYQAYIQFGFHKRDADNNDTYLFVSPKYRTIGTFYSVTGYESTFTASGTVASTDRLRITVVVNEDIPR